MEKGKIVLIRIYSISFLCALLILIYVLGVGLDLYQECLDRVNSENNYNMLYNVVFFTVMNAIYKIIISVGLFVSIMSLITTLLREKGMADFSDISGMMAIVIGIFLSLSVVLERSKAFHIFLLKVYSNRDLIYIYDPNASKYLGMRIIVMSIILVVIGAFQLSLVNSSGILRNITYCFNRKSDKLISIFPILFYTIYIEIFRKIVFNTVNANDVVRYQVNYIMSKYYFENMFSINVSYVIYIIAAALLTISIYIYNYKKKKTVPFLLHNVLYFVLALVFIISGVLMVKNPPKVYGFISYDEKICNLVEKTAVYYILMKFSDVFTIVAITSVCIESVMTGVSSKKIVFIMVLYIILSTVAIFACSIFASQIIVYIIMLVLNFLCMLCLCYATDVGQRVIKV